MDRKYFTWGLVVLALIGAIAYSIVLFKGQQPQTLKMYDSDQLGLSLQYPANYFVQEYDQSTGERNQYAIVLLEDTEENRDLIAGKLPGREGPPTISIGVFQNNLDNYTTEWWITGTSFSNFKLSDGKLTSTTIAGMPALAYRATGLYENDNVVVARPNYVYMFTAFYLEPSDQIRKDFEAILKTIWFK